ncbi:alpha/beta hydrolase family protein [Pseudomonas sp. PS1]|uniref:Alpha/beta hydrolase family protein n=1 Tax=Stutzerimonas marianensis TaxID=2929513 RepID=A0A9X2AT26_9GAMM|nr:DUF3530 family protein [Pseudomonas marianensis]MCJ0974599.1 alpha/beta hydrolase family protein [Pseudomonas marianensis]
MTHFRHATRALVLYLAALALTANAADQPSDEQAPAPDAAPAAPAERPGLPSRSEVMASDLLRQLPVGEVIELKTGTETFSALWRPANVGAPKGVLILLPDDGESPDWPRGIGPLRRQLPDHGWHTLSLSLPESERITPTAVTPRETPPTEAPTPEPEAEAEPSEGAPSEAGYLPEQTAPAASEPDEEGSAQQEGEAPVSAPAPLDLAERIDARIEAALAHIRTSQPDVIVMLGQGTGAYWAARYLQQANPGDVSRLILVQPKEPAATEEPLVQRLGTLKIAIGDFYFRTGSSVASARARLDESRRSRHPAYQQVGLQAIEGDRQAEQERLVRRVRGWLDRQG